MKRQSGFELDLSQTFPHLAGAPIAEAIIQWVARAAKPIVPEEFRKQLTERLPDYPACEVQQKLQFEAKFSPEGPTTQVQQDPGHGYRLTSADHRHIAQFTRDGLVASRLEPYGNWEEFSTEALRLWNVFVEVAQPREIERLGVRFINRISADVSNVGRFLAAAPKCLEQSGMPRKGFFFQSTHDVPGHPLQITVIQAIEPPAVPSAGGSGLILDIDVFTTRPLSVADEVVRESLTKMRWLKNKAFFSLVSKRAIWRFEKGKT
jgi:uncharacterized protein (TIGR04255 family)